MIDQVVFAFTGTSGMGPVASSLDRGATWDWHDKLRQHTRLSGAAPTISFSHLEFADGTATLLRRAGKAGDAGRNLAHALVGTREIIALIVPSMTRWEDGWLDTAPQSDQLPALSASLFGGPVESDVDASLLAPLVDLARSSPGSTFSVIGVPDELRLSAVWRLRELLPATTWTFSTYEKSDAAKPNLPRLIFLSERPHDSVEPEPGRLRVDVTEAANHPVLPTDDEPITEELPVQPPATPAPVQPDLPGVLYGDGPVHQRLRRLAEIVESQDIESVHQQAPAWLHDPAVPASLATYTVEYLEDKGFKDLDPPLARRWRAEQGMVHAYPAALETETARPPTDHALVDQVWQRQVYWSGTADTAKRKAVRYHRFTLIALITGAVVGAAQLAGQASQWLVVLTALVTFALVSASTYVRRLLEPAERASWTDARLKSEILKSAACGYLAGVGTADELRSHIDEIGPRSVPRTSSPTPSITDAATYAEMRIKNQIAYHEREANRYERNLRRAERWEVVFGVVAAAFSLAATFLGSNLAVWVGVCTTIAGAITAHVTQSGYQHMMVRFRRTATDLDNLLDALPTGKDTASLTAFVTECEGVLNQQNEDWLTLQSPSPGKEQR